MDFPHRRVLLDRAWPAGAPPVLARLPVVEHANVPFVRVDIRDQVVEVMIDTGADEGLHLPSEMASSLAWKQKPREGSLVAVIGEVSREGIGRLAGSLWFDRIRQVEPTTVVSPGAALLGLRWLDRFCLGPVNTN